MQNRNCMLCTNNQLSILPKSALKVLWLVFEGFESEFSDRLWLESSLGQAEQYKITFGIDDFAIVAYNLLMRF